MNKKSILSLAASIVFLAAMSYAQSTSGDQSQGTQGSSPTTQQDPSTGSSSGQSSGSMGQGSSSGQTSGSMGQGSSSGQSSGSMDQGSSSGSMSQGSSGMKGEKKMKGCITSEGGQYMLQDKHGKSTPLSGQDLSAHVGHEVTVHGSWGAGGGSSDASAGSSGSMSGASSGSSGSMSGGKTFNVTNVDMISETCTSSKTKSSSGSTQK